MNSYRTPHMRTAPQTQQRHFHITTSEGIHLNAHGIKGANGEWMLEVYANGWTALGDAYKRERGWTIYTATGQHTGRTLTDVIITATAAL